MDESQVSRRQFIQKSSLGVAAGSLGISDAMTQVMPSDKSTRLPREVWVGSISLEGIRMDNSEGMVQKVLQLMEHLVPYQPDIICLPEGFAYANTRAAFEVKKVAEKVPGSVVSPFQEFAKKHQCYVICPTYTRDKGAVYIAAVVIDRAGNIMGEYRKMRPTEGEIDSGVKPGPLDPPVFETDFGKIGIQICFDVKWETGWQKLKEAGAEIIFWPSAYGGGRELSSRAWRHQVYLVSSTDTDTSRICDMTGDNIAQTGRWQRNWICAPVNLEKTFLHTWPAVQEFAKIQKRYGRKIKITTSTEEQWTLIESLDAEVKVADILAEFKLPTHQELIQKTEQVQQLNR